MVCLDDVEQYDDYIPFPECQHKFHEGCLADWMRSHITCPVCRRRSSKTEFQSVVSKVQTERRVQQKAHLRRLEEMLDCHEDWLLIFRPKDLVILGPMEGNLDRLTRSEELADSHEDALCGLGMVPNDLKHPGEDPHKRGARLWRLEQLIKSHALWLRASINFNSPK
jgi:hypothetical protein